MSVPRPPAGRGRGGARRAAAATPGAAAGTHCLSWWPADGAPAEAGGRPLAAGVSPLPAARGDAPSATGGTPRTAPCEGLPVDANREPDPRNSGRAGASSSARSRPGRFPRQRAFRPSSDDLAIAPPARRKRREGHGTVPETRPLFSASPGVTSRKGTARLPPDPRGPGGRHPEPADGDRVDLPLLAGEGIVPPRGGRAGSGSGHGVAGSGFG